MYVCMYVQDLPLVDHVVAQLNVVSTMKLHELNVFRIPKEPVTTLVFRKIIHTARRKPFRDVYFLSRNVGCRSNPTCLGEAEKK